jgi:hypothetical protein
LVCAAGVVIGVVSRSALFGLHFMPITGSAP